MGKQKTYNINNYTHTSLSKTERREINIKNKININKIFILL